MDSVPTDCPEATKASEETSPTPAADDSDHRSSCERSTGVNECSRREFITGSWFSDDEGGDDQTLNSPERDTSSPGQNLSSRLVTLVTALVDKLSRSREDRTS